MGATRPWSKPHSPSLHQTQGDSKGTNFAELDQFQIHANTALDPQFQVVNRNSGKLLEVFGALTTDGAAVGQWGSTAHATQRWTVRPASGAAELVNLNSGKLLEIPSAQTADGIDAVQWAPTGHATQRWVPATSSGWWTFTNANSGKLLEIDGCSTADGAVAQQWPANGYPCQQWRLVKEGTQ
jgi:hypothetical protein